MGIKQSSIDISLDPNFKSSYIPCLESKIYESFARRRLLTFVDKHEI